MDLKKAITLGVVCVLVGILVGYLSWGLRSGRLANELAEVKARQQEEQRQVGAKFEQALKDLEFERQRRERLELLLSQGRK